MEFTFDHNGKWVGCSLVCVNGEKHVGISGKSGWTALGFCIWGTAKRGDLPVTPQVRTLSLKKAAEGGSGAVELPTTEKCALTCSGGSEQQQCGCNSPSECLRRAHEDNPTFAKAGYDDLDAEDA